MRLLSVVFIFNLSLLDGSSSPPLRERVQWAAVLERPQHIAIAADNKENLFVHYVRFSRADIPNVLWSESREQQLPGESGLLKLNAAGEMIWAIPDGFQSFTNFARMYAAEGDLFVLGNKSSMEGYLERRDSATGAVRWQVPIAAPNFKPGAVTVSSDGTVVVGGDDGNHRRYLFWFSLEGQLRGEVSGAGSQSPLMILYPEDSFLRLAPGRNGSVYFMAEIDGNDQETDLEVIHFDSARRRLWENRFGEEHAFRYEVAGAIIPNLLSERVFIPFSRLSAISESYVRAFTLAGGFLYEKHISGPSSRFLAGDSFGGGFVTAGHSNTINELIIYNDTAEMLDRLESQGRIYDVVQRNGALFFSGKHQSTTRTMQIGTLSVPVPARSFSFVSRTSRAVPIGPEILDHPKDITVVEGQSFSLSGVVTGAGSFRYQWIKTTRSFREKPIESCIFLSLWKFTKVSIVCLSLISSEKPLAIPQRSTSRTEPRSG
jgi:hypothetical protein